MIVFIVVDYEQHLTQMIESGQYGKINSDITAERFPLTGEGVAEFETRMFHFDHAISPENAIAAIERELWEPAKIEHLLAFGAADKDEQRKFPIFALGSCGQVAEDRCITCVYGDASIRILGLHFWGGDYNRRCRFLAIRKLSSGV